MRIEKLRVQNFRAVKDETIALNDYTCFVGPNGCAKSTILNALNIFFRHNGDSSTNLLVLSEEDFHNKDTSQPVVITVTFRDLSPEAQTDFAAYFRQGKLIVSAVATWNAQTRSAAVVQFGERLGMKEFAPFFKAEGDKEKVEELRKHYDVIRVSFPKLPAVTTKAKMVDALHEYEAANPKKCITIKSEDKFYGISGGRNLLEKYVQWVFVPAVKDASVEQFEQRQSALAQILQRTVRAKMSFSAPLEKIRTEAMAQYEKVLKENQDALSSLSSSLTNRVQIWAHPDTSVDLRWFSEAAKAVSLAEPLAQMFVKESKFEGQIGRFGHGFQRSFLLALLLELAATDTTSSPTLIFGCEEPELYQHPPQIRHLASTLNKLSDTGSQILVCTHSSHFIRGDNFEDIRMFRREAKTGSIRIKSATFVDYATKLSAIMGKQPLKRGATAVKVSQQLQPAMNEMFFTSVLILTEGVEDAAYIHAYMSLLNLWEEYRRLGCHVVSPYRGKGNLHQLMIIAELLGIPTYTVFDADGDKCQTPEKKARHENDNKVLLSICNAAAKPCFPADTEWGDHYVMWKDDIGSALKSDIGAAAWEKHQGLARAQLSADGAAELEKNPVFICEFIASCWDAGLKFPTLEKLCTKIIDFAKSTTPPKKAAAP